MNALKKYILKITIRQLIGPVLYILFRGFNCGYLTLLFFLIYCIVPTSTVLIQDRISPVVFKEENNIDTNSLLWYKILSISYYSIFYAIVFIVAALTINEDVPLTLFIIGSIVYVLSSILIISSTMVYTYPGKTSKTVCDSGPYSIIRHPVHASILINSFSIVAIFSSIEVIHTILLCDAIIVLRTTLEDKLLIKGLPGYSEYAKKVPHRLIPFIW